MKKKIDFLDLGLQPLANSYLNKNEFKKKEKKYRLKICFDVVTKLVSIKKTFSSQIMFDNKYPYRSSLSKTMNSSFKKYRHVGMYGFDSSILDELTSLKPTNREKNERLEQLRWIENEYEIYSSVIETPGIGVDTYEDLKKIRKELDRI